MSAAWHKSCEANEKPAETHPKAHLPVRTPWIPTPRLLSSSFLGVPYRILSMNHKKELLRSLWID